MEEQKNEIRERPMFSYVTSFFSGIRSWFGWLKPKRHPERDLSTLTQSLRTILGARLKSVLVFGSLASGDFNSETSNVNVLVVADLPFEVLPQLQPALKPWLKKGHTWPVLVTPQNLLGFARDFPIEFLDMHDHHRVVFGDNPLAELTVDKRHLQAQCEHDLALAQLRLRQAIIIAGEKASLLRAVLAKSLPSVLTLMRAIVRLDESAPKLDKIKAAEHLTKSVGHDVTVLHKLKDQHYRRDSDNVKDIAAHYLDLMEAVLKHLRK